MLQTLKEKKIKIGLISNCYSEEAVLIRESQLFPYFDQSCLSYELGMKKPDPGIFLKCMEGLGVRAGECLYIGDGGSHELEAADIMGNDCASGTVVHQRGAGTGYPKRGV